MQQKERIIIFVVLPILISLSVIVFTHAKAARWEYSKEFDAGRDILIVSPGDYVRIGRHSYLEFRIIAFNPNIAKITIIVCGKTYKAELVEERHGSLKFFVAKIPVKYTDIYSWKIRIVYNDNSVKETCTGRTIVEIIEEINRRSDTFPIEPAHYSSAKQVRVFQWHKPASI